MNQSESNLETARQADEEEALSAVESLDTMIKNLMKENNNIRNDLSEIEAKQQRMQELSKEFDRAVETISAFLDDDKKDVIVGNSATYMLRKKIEEVHSLIAVVNARMSEWENDLLQECTNLGDVIAPVP